MVAMIFSQSQEKMKQREENFFVFVHDFSICE